MEVGLLDLLVNCLKSDSEQLILISLTAQSKLFKKTKKQEINAFQDCSIIYGEFERLGGVDILEELQTHKSWQVYSLAYKTLNRYFEPEIIDFF